MRALLKFERENRAYFAAWVPDWGDDYFARFDARHRALLAEQSAGTCYFHLLVDGAGEVVGRVNLVDLPTVRPSSFTGSPSARPAGAGHVCGASGQWARVHRLRPDVAAGHTAPDNLASQAVLTWAGFVLAGSVELDGQPEVRFVRDLTVDGTGQPIDGFRVVRRSQPAGPLADWRARTRRRRMAKLIYSMITSLDGYAKAAEGDLGTGADDQEVHTFINDIFRPVGTYLYGRRMYETMVYWETAHTEPDQPPHILQYARDWQAAEKIVYSTTLESVFSAKTRIERTFDPDAVRKLKAEADHDLTVDGPNLAAQAIAAGLVDEYHLFITTSVVGGGKRFFPDGARLDLELVEERAFDSGLIYARYRTR